MKKVLIILLLMTSSFALKAQQEVLISQYMFNELFINPAYAGSHDYFDATVLHRSQWVEFEGAPVTQLLELEGPLFDKKMGVGLTLVNDNIGDTHQFEINGNVSYHLDLDAAKKNRISFGLRLGVSNYSARLSRTDVIDELDPVFLSDIQNEWVSKVGAGIYYYGKNKYLGVSIPTLYSGDKSLRFNLDSSSVTDDFYFENHLFATAGIVFPIGANVKMKPNLLVKYQRAAPVEIDFSANFLFKELIWLGATYRTDDAVVGMLELNVTNQLRLGYAYDFTLSDIATYSSGSHEIMLGYRFGKDIIKTKSPRYF